MRFARGKYDKGVAFGLDNICVQNQLFPSEADEPPPGDVAGIEGCREWAEFWMVDRVAFLHYDFDVICIYAQMTYVTLSQASQVLRYQASQANTLD